jgi:serine O-acetyltransferase
MKFLRLLKLIASGRGCELAPGLLYELQASRKEGRRVAARIYCLMLERWYGVFVGSNASIGRGIRLPHPVAIVIGDGVVLGEGVTLYQNVTLGALRAGGGGASRYPVVEDGATFFSGSSALGSVRIGRSAIIGANSLVLHDVPSGATVVGAPARVVRGQENSA